MILAAVTVTLRFSQALTGMGGAAPAAAAPFPGKATRIFRKGQRSTIKLSVSFKTARLFYEPVCLGGVKSASALFACLVNSCGSWTFSQF